MLAHKLDTALPAAGVLALGGDAVLAHWNAPGRRGAGVRALAAGAAVRPPITSLTLPTVGGDCRVVVALRPPAAAGATGPLLFVGAAGEPLAEAAPQPERFDPTALLEGLDAAARLRLVRLVLDTCAGLFRLGADAGFAMACRALLLAAFPPPTPLVPRLALTPRLIVADGALPAGLGTPERTLVVTANGVRRNGFAPAMASGGGEGAMLLTLDRAAGEPGALVAFLGERSAACTAVAPAGALPPLLEWLGGNHTTPAATREYLAASLARAAATDPAAVAAAREMQLCLPLKRRNACVPDRPIGADVELAVGHGTGGLFAAGWLHDPHDLIVRLTAISPTGRRIDLPPPRHRFPRADVARRYRQMPVPAACRLGFIAFAPHEPEPVPACQHRFELRLASGATLEVVPPPQPAGLADARAAVLGSIPAPFLTPEALQDCIAPPTAALHAACMATKRAPEETRFGDGPARPSVSIVVPLYRNLSFLRFQVAALATDPDMAGAEILYVLDSPEQAPVVKDTLAGLHALYGLPLRLLVMSGNYGFAAASNAGAAVARARTLLFLNSDVVPDRPGWLTTLSTALTARRKVGAVGPKLLFDDDSLQHAGLFFWRDRHGRWINRHFYKGLPRRFPPAEVERAVPGLTGACLMVRRALFERVGGFSEDYVIGDFEDSDLCLKLRTAGAELRYVPAAELYHLERRSIVQHAGYTRSVASEYNALLHALRWSALMADVMAREACPASLPAGPATPPAGPDRRLRRRPGWRAAAAGGHA